MQNSRGKKIINTLSAVFRFDKPGDSTLALKINVQETDHYPSCPMLLFLSLLFQTTTVRRMLATLAGHLVQTAQHFHYGLQNV